LNSLLITYRVFNPFILCIFGTLHYMRLLCLFFILTVTICLGYFLYTTPPEIVKPSTTSLQPIQAPTVPLPLGRHFMIGHSKEMPTASTTALLVEHQLAGVIIMSAPANPDEIKAWTKEWQAAVPYPLIIAIDQEGGEVSRLRGAQFDTTSQRSITTTDEAYNLGYRRGLELAGLGITTNFAPVLDSATIATSFMYNRVFSSKENSAALAAAMVTGMARSGITAVPKHFPGHADTPDDSHDTLPHVDMTKSEFAEYSKPFTTLLRTDQPQMLMTAHIVFPQIDSLPATLSPYFLNTYVRSTLAYDGLIITDDMCMKAIDTTWGAAEGSRLALLASVDIVLIAAEPERIGSILTYIREKTDNALRTALEKSDIRMTSFTTNQP
jgi:beta-N-acetylhexosaminidase